VGYITPVGQWNRGKQQEFADRQVYRVANNGERQC
jgi:anaerobic ribonucleoside-triphosphate reductase